MVVNSHKKEITDVYIEDGIIKKIGKDLQVNETNIKIIDCTGKYVMPGGIDTHVHVIL
jgi:dihydropyrimidinase